MQNKLRVALAQVNYQPSYVSTDGNFICEPTIFKDPKKGIISLLSTNEIKTLKSRIKKYNLSNIKTKIKSILEFCNTKQIDLLVFPEYSIPADLLDLCYDYAIKNEAIVIAGTHSVIADENSIIKYNRCNLLNNGKLCGIESLEDSIRKAICPIFTPNGNHIIRKLQKSSWEGEMVVDDNWNVISINYPGISIKIAVLICIDAISHESRKILYNNGLEEADIVIIPSFSPSTEPFKIEALSHLINEKPTIYCNTSEYGGSKIYANHGGKYSDIFMVSDGTVDIGNSESVIAVEINLSGQYQKAKSTKTYFPVKSICNTPILYPSENPICNNYCSEVNNIINDFNYKDAELFVRKFIQMSKLNLPKLLDNKLNRALNMLEESRATANEAKNLIEVIEIDKQYLCQTDLRFSLIKYSINSLTKLISSYEEKTKLFEVLMNLGNEEDILKIFGANEKYIKLDEIYDTEEDIEIEPEANFENRGGAFDALSGFINSDKFKIFYLEGTRGIGKSSFINEFFKRKLKNISIMKINATKGISYERFLFNLCELLKIKVDPIVLLNDNNEIATLAKKTLVEKNKFLVIDEFHFMIRNNDFYDSRIGEFIYDVIVDQNNFNLILISDISLTLPSKLKKLCDIYFMRRIKDVYISRIMENTIRTLNLVEEIETPKIPSDLIDIIDGHPLAAIICATLFKHYKFEQIAYELKPYMHFKEKIIKELIQKNEISYQQTEILFYISLYNSVVPYDFFEYLYDNAFELLESLQYTYLIKKNDSAFSLHPLIKDYYIQKIPAEQRVVFHGKIADYFKNKIEGEGFLARPSILADFIYHSAFAGKDLETNEYLKLFKEELRPAGIYAYRQRDYTTALKYFLILLSYDDNDFKSHFRISLCYCRLNKPDKAREHFNKAIKLKPAWWIYQGYANAIMRYSYDEAETYIHIAYEMAPKEVSVLSTMGRILLRRWEPDIAKGINFYRAAINRRPDDMFLYIDLVRNLIRVGAKEDAIWYINKGLGIDSENEELIELKCTIKSKRELSEEDIVENKDTDDVDSDWN